MRNSNVVVRTFHYISFLDSLLGRVNSGLVKKENPTKM